MPVYPGSTQYMIEEEEDYQLNLKGKTQVEHKNIMVYFAGLRCSAKAGKYENGQVSISLLDHRRWLHAIATVALDTEYLRYVFGINEVPEGWVIIKEYSENQGIFEALVKAQVVTDGGAIYGGLPPYQAKVVLCKLITELP